MAKDEAGVQVDRALVVLSGFTKFTTDEVELRTVVVDIGVIGILVDSGCKIVGGRISITCFDVDANG